MTVERKKEIGILVFFGIYTVLFILLVSFLVRDIRMLGMHLTLLAVTSGLLWIALVSSCMAFAIDRKLTYGLLTAVPPVVIVVVGMFSVASFIGGLLFAVLLAAARYSIHREMKSRVEFHTYMIFRHANRLVTLGIIIALLSLALPAVRWHVERGGLHVSSSYIKVMLRPFTSLISKYIPDYSEQATVDDMIDAQLNRQLSQFGRRVTVPPQQKAQLRRSFSERLGVELQGNETLPDVVTTVVNQHIDRMVVGNGVLVTIVLIIVALFTLRAVVPLVAWPALVVIAACIFFARKVGLVRIEDVEVAAQRLRL